MATVNQIYSMVNDAAEESLGAHAVRVKDTASLVSLGGVVLSSDDYKDAFYGKLCDRIGRTVIAVRALAKKNRRVKKDEMEWGVIYQKISFKDIDASKNSAWDAANPESPYAATAQGGIVQMLFTVMSTFKYEDVIPDGQLFTAFTSAEKMGAFISAIYQRMDNALTRAENNLANLAVNTNMAGIMIKGKNTQKRNVLSEFITASGKTYDTIEEAHMDADYLKYVTREIKTAVGNLAEESVLFNITDDIPRQTTRDRLVVEVLGRFASAVASYLESDTYHNEMVALPGYEEVAYWQNPGTSFAFDDISKIDVKNAELKVNGNATGTCKQAGIIAFLHDEDSCASIIARRRDHSIYDGYNERYVVSKKADQGYAVDLSENGIVFYEELPVVPDEPGEG